MKTIIIDATKYAKYDDRSSFPLGDLKLKISGLPAVPNSQYRYIAYMNGTKVGQYTITPTNNTVEIATSSLEAGSLSGVIIQYVAGIESKRWEVEALVITDLDDVFSAVPEICKLKDDMAQMKANHQTQIEAMTKEIKQIKERFNAAVVMINALGSFAFDDFSSNIYLDGSDKKEDFIEKYGIKPLLEIPMEDNNDE